MPEGEIKSEIQLKEDASGERIILTAGVETESSSRTNNYVVAAIVYHRDQEELFLEYGTDVDKEVRAESFEMIREELSASKEKPENLLPGDNLFGRSKEELTLELQKIEFAAGYKLEQFSNQADPTELSMEIEDSWASEQLIMEESKTYWMTEGSRTTNPGRQATLDRYGDVPQSSLEEKGRY